MPERKKAARPTQGPAFDEKTFAQRLHERVRTPKTNQPYAVFKSEYFPAFIRWVRGSGEYDGGGLRDVVNTNAIFVDEIKADLDAHLAADNARHQALAQRVAALEESPLFPG